LWQWWLCWTQQKYVTQQIKTSGTKMEAESEDTEMKISTSTFMATIAG
jgi:hypothetical protein